MRRLGVPWVIGFAGIAVVACGSNHDQGSSGPSPKGASDAGSSSSTGQDATTMPRPDPSSTFNGAIGKGAYWLQNTSLKVQPTTAPGPLDGEIDIEGPRDSVESYQIVLHPTGGGMKNVNATATALTSDGGPPSIAAANVTLFRQFFIDFGTIDQTKNIGGVLPCRRTRRRWTNLPDPLIPFVDPYSGMPARCAVQRRLRHEPAHLGRRSDPEGRGGRLVQRLDQHHVRRPGPDGRSRLARVGPGSRPARSITTYFKIDWGNINGFHKGLDTAYPDNDPATKVIVKRYQELAHTHRIDPLEIWVPYPNGCTPPTDWSDFDSILQPYMDGTYWDDKIPSTYFGAGIDVGSSSCTDSQYAAVAKAWSAHLKAKGWFNQTYAYAVDEPNEMQLAQIEQQSGWAQEGDPDWKPHIIDTTMPRTSTAPMLNEALGIYVVCLKCYDAWELMDDPSDPAATSTAARSGRLVQLEDRNVVLRERGSGTAPIPGSAPTPSTRPSPAS